MFTLRKVKLAGFCLCTAFTAVGLIRAADDLDTFVAGPIFSEYRLTLEPGERTEAVGPLYYSQTTTNENQFGFPPLFTWGQNPELEVTEWSFAYPLVSYNRFGEEYRVHICQLMSWAGGKSQTENTNSRFTIFPLYFQQRNKVDPSQDYTAFAPFAGHLKNRLFRDDIRFIMFPIYSETRKKDVVTGNYLYPIYHQRHGNNLTGWQVWPFVGSEYKGVTYKTNQLDEAEVIGGHHHYFAGWPIYFHNWDGLGTTNAQESLTVVPFYHQVRSPLRDSTSYGWPLGYSIIDDREKKYQETQYLGPFVVFANGEGKTTSRVFPFYSLAKGGSKESEWYLWPVYKVNRLHADLLERERLRILFFLYSDTVEKNTNSGESLRHVDCFPLFSARREMDGKERLQVLSLIEPFVPNSSTVPREYAPVYSLWVSERDPKTDAVSQKCLWNLYRRDTTPHEKRVSILFGLLQYHSKPEGDKWRICFIPFGKNSHSNPKP